MPQAPEHRDDLTEVDGIGPVTAGRLSQAGIDGFARLAAADPADLARIANVSVAYVQQRDWVGQAAALAHPAPPDDEPGSVDDDGLRPPGRASFTVELQRDASSGTLTTRIRHVQGDDEETWIGWGPHRTVAFIEAHLPPALAAAGRDEREAVAAGDGGLSTPEGGCDEAVRPATPRPTAEAPARPGPPAETLLAFGEVRAPAAATFTGQGLVATLHCGPGALPGGAQRATAVDVSIYGRRSPVGGSRLLGRGRRQVVQGAPVDVDVVIEPAAHGPLNVFAVVELVGPPADAPPARLGPADATLTLTPA